MGQGLTALGAHTLIACGRPGAGPGISGLPTGLSHAAASAALASTALALTATTTLTTALALSATATLTTASALSATSLATASTTLSVSTLSHGTFLHCIRNSIGTVLAWDRLPIPGQLVMPATDTQGRAANQRPGHKGPGLGQHPSEGMPGHAHADSRRLGGQAFQIGQTQGFESLNGQPDLLQVAQGYALGLEIGGLGHAGHPPAHAGSWHNCSFVLLN